MRSTTREFVGALFLLLSAASYALGSEADELRGKAKAIRSEAAVLAEQGKKDEAERLVKQSQELLEKAEQLESQAKKGDGKARPDKVHDKRNIKEVLQDLMAREQKLRESKASERELDEVREQIAAIHQKLKSGKPHFEKLSDAKFVMKGLPPEFQEQAKNLEHAMRRLQHIRVAAENLKAAEMHDVAGALAERAEQMEGEIREAKERLTAEMGRFHASRDKQVPESVEKDLRIEIEKLRAEIKELREKAKPQ